ncbi:hypothetical protein CEN40_07735 [Fischerella thermalis CCMEE 5205]|uniref:Uncharacterized protein n=1 Tax=Fischerella thermalis CCMEE 5318 TaxID=2019666 RepID=A0A2N6LN14_9CYAN|nr:hypothetical protein [Fischerella thermalis]PMB26836.1 hypothetical protein CEN46_02690 [Fischerella thermalis CCMEE 5318]PMB47951.1 hypothetical protein CEN40_07735 [Fischerella thermalis CCMEE 5205]
MPQYPFNIGIEAVPAKIISFSNFKNAANNNILMPFPSRLTQNRFRRDEVKQKAKSNLQDIEESLRAEVAALQQELTITKQQKAELESLLKQQEQERKLRLQQMQIEIDLHKVAYQVAEITQTDYFQQLQIEIESLRNADC